MATSVARCSISAAAWIAKSKLSSVQHQAFKTTWQGRSWHTAVVQVWTTMDNQQRAKELSAKRAPTSNNAATCGAWGKSHSSSNGRCRSRRSYMGTVESHFQNSTTCPHSCRLPTPHPALQHTKALVCPGWTGSFPHKLSQAPHDSLYVLFSFVTAT